MVNLMRILFQKLTVVSQLSDMHGEPRSSLLGSSIVFFKIYQSPFDQDAAH